jgi:hypothetical protein
VNRATLTRWGLGAAILAAVALQQATLSPYRLSAAPNPATVGQTVTFVPSYAAGTPPPAGSLYVDFGDGSPRAAVRWFGSVAHAYAQPGQYRVQLLLASTLMQTLATVVETVTAPATPAPRAPALSVQTLALTWPNGSTSLTLSGTSPPPQPLAVVQTSGAGTLVLLWQLDGNAFVTVTQPVTAAGNQRVALTTPLPNSGSHSVSVRLISPPVALGAQPTPPPPISYSYPGAPPAPVAFYNGPPPTVKFPPLSFTFVEGKIDLLTPQWGYDNNPTCVNEACNNFGTPMLDDSVFFSWHEENPGIADYFELHILNRYGHVLAKEQLADGTPYFTPDPAFLENALKAIYADVAHRRRVIADASSWDVAFGLLRIREAVNLKWEVRGYKRFTQGSQTKTVEVEKSDQWPLGVPNDANGINACPASQSGLQYVNLALQTSPSNRLQMLFLNFESPAAPPAGATNITNYIGDPVVIEGNIDLSGSPYLSKPGTVNAGCPEVGTLCMEPIREVDFDNLFVDWGDGTVEPVRAVPAQGTTAGGAWVQRKPQAIELSLPVPANAAQNLNAGQFSDSNGVNVNMHRYTTTGTFTIRIFQLSESDVQHMSPSDIGAYVDAAAITQSNPYFHVMHLPLSKSPSKSSLPFIHFAGALGNQNPTPADATARAYQIYCGTITIDEGVDPYAEGPLYLQSVKITDFPNHEATAPPASFSAASVYGVCSTCDDDVTALAQLQYYGRGDAIETWSLDGLTLETKQIQGLSSPPRHGLGRNPTGGTPLSGYATLAPSQTLSTKQGHHVVRVQVSVAPPAPSLANIDLLAEAGRISSSSIGMKVGFLSPFTHASNKLPTVAYIGAKSSAPVLSHIGPVSTITAPMRAPLRGLMPLKAAAVVNALVVPGQSVASGPAIYDAEPANPKVPCKFEFATKEGTFEISGLQNHVQKTGSGTWSGHGSVLLNFQTGGNSVEAHPVRVDFQNWSVPDGVNVTAGTIHVTSPPDAQNLHLTGVTAGVATLDGRTDGKPDYDMTMGLNLVLSDQNLRVIANPPHPPAWNDLVAPVYPDGTWIYKNATIPSTEIGHSQFFIASSTVTFDFSKGVELGNATLAYYTLGLAGTPNNTIAIQNWIIDGEGLEGSVDQNVGWKATFQNGFVSIPRVTANVSKSDILATYPNMTAHIPFIDADLNGTATIVTGGNAYFPLTAAPVSRQFGQITIAVDNLEFEAQQGLGWVVGCDGHFDFSNGPNHFAHVDVPHMFFTFAGRPVFSGGSSETDIPLGGNTVFGNTPLQLQSAHLIAPTGGNDQLDVAFAVTVHLSQSQYMPAAKTQVNYRFYEQGSQYLVAPPTMNPFDEEVAFPAAQPASDSHVHPVYQQTANGGQYVGDVDLGMFGGPPVRAQFLLGYQGSTDYWLFRADVQFPGSGIILIPGIMSLFSIGGGAGYHIHLQNPQDVNTASFDPNSDLTMLAGLALGSTDNGYTYYLNGNFTITVGNNPSVRMDYSAWFATADHGGAPAIDGYFQWAGGNFDGGLEGKFAAPSPLDSLVYFEIPGPRYGSSQYAASLHFGSGDWHIYVGQKNGPRIEMHLLVADVDGFLMLSDSGVDLGGSEHMHLGVGDSSVASAYIDFEGDIELAITSQPHISGDFSESASCGVCIASGCFSVSESVSVHAEAMPLSVSACASIGVPWPLPSINICVHL